MLRRRLNFFDRIEGLNEGLGVEARIYRDPLVVQFVPRRNPFFPVFEGVLENKVTFEVLSQKEVAVIYVEMYYLDRQRTIPSVREQIKIINFSTFKKILSVYRVIPKNRKMKRC